MIVNSFKNFYAFNLKNNKELKKNSLNSSDDSLRSDSRAKNLTSPLTFKGSFYAMTDTHSRIPAVARVLSEIENRCPKDERAFFLDCGDFLGENYTFSSIADVYSTFQKRNPNINCVFNLGNYDLSAFLGSGPLVPYEKQSQDIIKKMADSGIQFVSASYCLGVEDLKEQGINIPKNDAIKPYTVLDDNDEKILVVGISTNKTDKFKWAVDKQKEALKFAQDCAQKDGVEADKTIILLHDIPKNANELIKYAKEELNYKNIELVLGGHPHGLEDYSQNGTRFLYPPAQGKGAIEIINDEDGFNFEAINTQKSSYDYSVLADNKSAIDNSDINNPVELKESYQTILDDSKNDAFSEVVCKNSPYTLTFRNYEEELSAPTSFGTFVANKYRDLTNSDIGLFRNQTTRENLPSKGKSINRYNLCDTINLDSDIHVIKNASIEDLKALFEVSLENQNSGITNGAFLEYSDNIRLTRQKGDGDKVKQIEIKENGKWTKLLDENSKAIDKNKTFSIACEDGIAAARLSSFSHLNFNNHEQYDNYTTRSLLVEALNEEIPNEDEPNYHQSEIITVD